MLVFICTASVYKLCEIDKMEKNKNKKYYN